MTDRDHFAAAALTGLLAGHTHDALEGPLYSAEFAQIAYNLADAMLARRAVTNDPKPTPFTDTCPPSVEGNKP